MNPKTLPVLLAVAAIASTAFYLYVLAEPRPGVSSFPSLPSEPEIAHTRAVGIPDEPAWHSSVAESRTASVGSAPANDARKKSEPPAKRIPNTTSVPAAGVPQKLRAPLVLQELDYQATGFTATQVQILTSLREDFVREVGGARQDPNDPRYAERWRELQPRYDDKLRAFFGGNFVEQLGRLAAQAEYDAERRP